MGTSNSTQLPHEPLKDIPEFRMLSGPTEELVIPEIPHKRKATDKIFLCVFCISLAVLMPFVIYSFTQSDTDRFFRGRDECGDICGRNNTPVAGSSCSGKDQTNFPYLFHTVVKTPISFMNGYYTEETTSKCVEECPEDFMVIMNRCVSPKFVQPDVIADVIGAIYYSIWDIVGICLFGLGLALGMVFLLRRYIGLFIWVAAISSIISLIPLTVLSWSIYANSSPANERKAFYSACALTFTSVVLVVVLICLIQRFKLIMRLYKESMNIIFSMPAILLEPIVFIIASTILFVICISFSLIWTTSMEDGPNSLVLFTYFFHFVMCLWIYQFMMGCHHMVVSGAVSAYYFSRDKLSLTSPVYTSLYNMVYYHLGTVSFGSLVVTIVIIVRFILETMSRNKYGRLLVCCCMSAIENLIRYFSKYAYIQTAMHGQPFYKSGKRAVKLLVANAMNTLTVNSAGTILLHMTKFMIVVFSVGFGYLIVDPNLNYRWIPLSIGGVIVAIFVQGIFGIVETAVNTIFLCYCEDNILNDGVTRPYFMTVNLMQYIEDAKKFETTKKQQNVALTETTNPVSTPQQQ